MRLMIAYTPPDINSNSVTTDVMLATNVGHGVSITWGSSDTNVIAVSGEVTRPAFGEMNATVTLTATLSKGAESATKSFTLTVLVGDSHPNDGAPNLIDINNLQELNAMRYDLDGNGEIDPNVNSLGSNVHQMAFPGLDPNQSYRGYELMSNLDFAGSAWASNRGSNGLGWDPIGKYDPFNSSISFRAIFEGNGKVISGLYINRRPYDNQGLFTAIRTTNAEVRNLGLSNVWVTGSANVGGLVAHNDEGRITTSYVTGTVTGSSSVGGLVGNNDGGRITTSYVTGTVTGANNVGGLVGFYFSGTITASYATSTVAAFSSVGGLVGQDSGGTITASYATGTVSGSNNVGGLVGQDSGGTITDSYFDSNTVGTQHALSTNGTGYTTVELQAPTDYTGHLFELERRCRRGPFARRRRWQDVR